MDKTSFIKNKAGIMTVGTFQKANGVDSCQEKSFSQCDDFWTVVPGSLVEKKTCIAQEFCRKVEKSRWSGLW